MAPIIGRTSVGESLKTIIICVDSYVDSLLVGSIHHGSLNEGRKFKNLMQMLLIIEDVLDDTGFPKATTEKRRFNTFKSQEKGPDVTEGGIDPHLTRGELATFKLKVMFRHNSSWQGSVAWMDGNSEEPFRSALEFLMLLDSAIAE